MRNLTVLLTVILITTIACQKDDELDGAYNRSGTVIVDTTGGGNNGNTGNWVHNPEAMTFIGSSYTGVSGIYSYQFRVSLNNSLVNPDLNSNGNAFEHLFVPRTVSGQITYYNQSGQAEFKLSQNGNYIYVTIISVDSRVNWNISVGDGQSPRWFLAFGPWCEYTKQTGQPNSHDDGTRNYYSMQLIGGNIQ